ncbi:MAG: hypothetical protein RR128_08185 [Clostridium sp.]
MKTGGMSSKEANKFLLIEHIENLSNIFISFYDIVPDELIIDRIIAHG